MIYLQYQIGTAPGGLQVAASSRLAHRLIKEVCATNEPDHPGCGFEPTHGCLTHLLLSGRGRREEEEMFRNTGLTSSRAVSDPLRAGETIKKIGLGLRRPYEDLERAGRAQLTSAAPLSK